MVDRVIAGMERGESRVSSEQSSAFAGGWSLVNPTRRLAHYDAEMQLGKSVNLSALGSRGRHLHNGVDTSSTVISSVETPMAGLLHKWAIPAPNDEFWKWRGFCVWRRMMKNNGHSDS
jgi:hypothetical protein